jgi:hypothetical protein
MVAFHGSFRAGDQGSCEYYAKRKSPGAQYNMAPKRRIQQVSGQTGTDT